MAKVSSESISSDQFRPLQTGSMDGSGDRKHDDTHLESLLATKAPSGESSKPGGSENGEGFRTPLNTGRVWARHNTAIPNHTDHQLRKFPCIISSPQKPSSRQPDSTPESTFRR